MDDSKNLIGYSGVYDFIDDAQADFDLVKDAHRNKWIGAYDAALFMKNAEGKVKVLNIDATQRTSGAKAGAIVGAVMGIIFPPSVRAWVPPLAPPSGTWPRGSARATSRTTRKHSSRVSRASFSSPTRPLTPVPRS
jgi:hypothetical protein